MSFIKTLKLTPVAGAKPDPVVRRRESMMARLQDQLARISDDRHVRVKQRWVRSDGGDRQLTERQVAIRPWWRQQRDGSVIFTLKVGMKRIELTCPPEMLPFFGRVCFSRGRTNELARF